MSGLRKWQPTPVFLPGESQGWGSLVGCRLWDCTESDTTEVTQQQGNLITVVTTSIQYCTATLSRALRGKKLTHTDSKEISWTDFFHKQPNCLSIVIQSPSCVWLSATPWTVSTPGFPVPHHLPEFAQVHVHWISDSIQPSHSLSSPSPSAFNLSQHQGLFQWAGSLHQVARVFKLQLQLQHQSFQRVFRVDFL